MQNLKHRATGQTRKVYLKNKNIHKNLTVEVKGDFHINDKGVLNSFIGQAYLIVDNDEQIALEWDGKKQQFYYIVTEEGMTFSDWSYRDYEAYYSII
jgi:hypothetical protein